MKVSFCGEHLINIVIRPWTQHDIHRLLDIEEAVHVSPWNKDAFLMCWQQGYHGYVAIAQDTKSDGQKTIIGFIIYSAQAEECHILNISVINTSQRQGVGEKLLTHALKQAHTVQFAHIAFLEVRRSNTRAIHLYEKLQFQLISERKNYYQGPYEPEDALIFAKLLT